MFSWCSFISMTLDVKDDFTIHFMNIDHTSNVREENWPLGKFSILDWFSEKFSILSSSISNEPFHALESNQSSWIENLLSAEGGDEWQLIMLKNKWNFPFIKFVSFVFHSGGLRWFCWYFRFNGNYRVVGKFSTSYCYWFSTKVWFFGGNVCKLLVT